MTEAERLQDYVDGRMSAAERTAFEAELARNPELAAAERFARELGKTLRAAPLELPPGFHARARARFEASQPRRFGLPRRLPWEWLGLAAAAALVVVLLFPWTKNGRPGVPSVAPLDAPATIEEPRDQLTSAPPVNAKAVAPETAASGTLSREADSSLGKRAAGAPMPVLADSPAPATPAGVAPRAQRMRADDELNESRAKEESALEARAAEIPPGSLPRGASQLVDSAEDGLWLALTTGANGTAIRALDPDFANERVFAFGPLDRSLSCRGVRLRTSAVAFVVLAGPGNEAEPAAPGGCAVVIPRRNLPVVLEAPGEN